MWENPPYFADFGNFTGICPFGQTTTSTGQPCGVSHNMSGLVASGNTVPPNPEFYFGNVQSQNLDFKQGMVQQYNLNIEHQLPGNVVLTAGYAGSRSTHILVDGLNLKLKSPYACGVDPSYTLGCGYLPRQMVRSTGLSRTISTTTTSAAPDTTLCKSKAKPKVHATDSTH